MRTLNVKGRDIRGVVVETTRKTESTTRNIIIINDLDQARDGEEGQSPLHLLVRNTSIEERGLTPLRERERHSTLVETWMGLRNLTIRKRWIRREKTRMRSGSERERRISKTDPKSHMSSKYSHLLPVRSA